MTKYYWVDADVDGSAKIGSWGAKSKKEAVEKFKEFYISLGVPEREILIRNVK